METKTKVILGISLLAAAGIGVTLYFVLRKKTDEVIGGGENFPQDTESTPSTTPETVTDSAPGGTPPKGTKIKKEIALARAKAAGNLKYPPPRTRSAKIKAYQDFVTQKMAQYGYTYVKNS